MIRALKKTLRLLPAVLGTIAGMAATTLPTAALVQADHPGWAGIYLAVLFLGALYGSMLLGRK